MKFHRICLTGSKYLTFTGLIFQGNLYRKKFCKTKIFPEKSIMQKLVKDKNLQKKKEHALSLQTLLYSCLKFVSPRMRFAVKILKENKENHQKRQKK